MLISKFNIYDVDNRIDSFEKQFNIILPKEYKAFLKKYNGGRTPKTKFRINRVSSDVRGFYGLGEVDEFLSFSKLEKLGILKKYLEKGFIPFANNTFGDYITIGISDNNYGLIYFFYHDREHGTELANGFANFIKKCKSEKLGHIKTIEERKQHLISKGNEKNITPDWIEAWQEEIDLYSNINQEEVIV